MSNEDEIESLGFDPDVTGNIGGRLELAMSGINMGKRDPREYRIKLFENYFILGVNNSPAANERRKTSRVCARVLGGAQVSRI